MKAIRHQTIVEINNARLPFLRQIIPVGPQGGHQSLLLVTKDKDGNISSTSLMGYFFLL